MRWHVRKGADLGTAVAELRSQLGIDQERVAALNHMARSRLSLLESGNSTKRVDDVIAVLRSLGAEVTIEFPQIGSEPSDAAAEMEGVSRDVP